MSSFLLHTTPIELPANNKSVSLNDINQKNFDFKSHFEADKILEISSDWWLVNKSKPWGLLDCMFISADFNIKTSFADFSLTDLERLFASVYLVTQILSNTKEVKKIILGANIIHNSRDDRHFHRLHFHCLGFTQKELDSMSDINLSQFKKLNPAQADRLFHPLVPQFIKNESDSIKNIFLNLKPQINPFDMGFQIRFQGQFNLLIDENFIKSILKLDEHLKSAYPNNSYNFCLSLEQGNLLLSLTPQGAGVLETLGILLQRSEKIKYSKADLVQKYNFYQSLQSEFRSKNPDLILGSYLSYLSNLI